MKTYGKITKYKSLVLEVEKGRVGIISKKFPKFILFYHAFMFERPKKKKNCDSLGEVVCYSSFLSFGV